MTIHPLPDVLNGFATARAVLDEPTDDPEVIEAAIDVLNCSEWFQDRIRVREARARLVELTIAPTCHELGSMAPHFAAMNHDHRQAQRRWGALLLVLAVMGLAHVTLAAPGKTTRTLHLHHQIEEARE